jgi:hypothetical protein
LDFSFFFIKLFFFLPKTQHLPFLGFFRPYEWDRTHQLHPFSPVPTNLIGLFTIVFKCRSTASITI